MIDDDVELCQELSEILKDEGYQVETAGDGRAGINFLTRGDYDLVILDYRMPSLSGMEVLKFVKKRGISSRIFLVSGRPFIEKLIKEEGLSDQVACVMNKPFDIKALLDNIGKL